jgi:hypothetical protein
MRRRMGVNFLCYRYPWTGDRILTYEDWSKTLAIPLNPLPAERQVNVR